MKFPSYMSSKTLGISTAFLGSVPGPWKGLMQVGGPDAQASLPSQ
jgi:hypothetical protein